MEKVQLTWKIRSIFKVKIKIDGVLPIIVLVVSSLIAISGLSSTISELS